MKNKVKITFTIKHSHSNGKLLHELIFTKTIEEMIYINILMNTKS